MTGAARPLRQKSRSKRADEPELAPSNGLLAVAVEHLEQNIDHREIGRRMRSNPHPLTA